MRAGLGALLGLAILLGSVTIWMVTSTRSESGEAPNTSTNTNTNTNTSTTTPEDMAELSEVDKETFAELRQIPGDPNEISAYMTGDGAVLVDFEVDLDELGVHTECANLMNTLKNFEVEKVHGAAVAVPDPVLAEGYGALYAQADTVAASCLDRDGSVDTKQIATILRGIDLRYQALDMR